MFLNKLFLRVFSKAPSVRSVMKAISRGKFDGVAQTSGYIKRVKGLKEKIDQVLVYADMQGIYLPTYVTSAQRALPLHGKAVLGYVGEGLEPMSGTWRRALGEGTSGVDPRGRYLTDGRS